MPQADKEFRLTGRHVFLMLAAFFGVIFAANILLVYQSNRSWTGKLPGNGYEASIKFNKEAARARAMLAKGWKSTVVIEPDGRIAVSLVDRNGRPVTGLRAVATLGRPAGNREDFTVELQERKIGVYETTQELKSGGWRIETRFFRGPELVWRSEAEFIVKPE